MPRRQQQPTSAKNLKDDLSFPVPYREQAKYLKLADDFLALDQRLHHSHKVIPIDRDRTVCKRKKAA
jgi:hypothetical protein